MTRERDQGGGGAEQAPPPSVDDRLLRATIDVVATVGYAAAQTEDIVRASGLSRTVFYRHLGGKRRATLAAARGVLDGLDRAVRAAAADEGLSVLFGALAADPPAAAVLVLEAPAVGPDAQALRTDLLTLIDAILGEPAGLHAWSPAGAVLHVLHRRVSRGQTADLLALVPDLGRTRSSAPPGARRA